MKLSFRRKAEPSPSVPVSGTLDTKFGLLKMNRTQLASGAIAYLCHNAAGPENARLDFDRVIYTTFDRNHSEAHDPNNMLSEEPPVCGGKNDLVTFAEDACNQQTNMQSALVVVFFDHMGDKTGNATDVLKELRTKFPAGNPELDNLEGPPEESRLRLVQDNVGTLSAHPPQFCNF
jgi:hypothetical protein